MKKEEMVWFDDDPHPYILKKPYIYKTVLSYSNSYLIVDKSYIKSYSEVVLDKNNRPKYLNKLKRL